MCFFITALDMRPLLDTCKPWRFLILLGMLLVLLVVQPILVGFSGSPVWFDALSLPVTVALLFSFSLDRRWRTAAYALGITSAVLSLGGHLIAAPEAGVVLLVGHFLGSVLLLLGMAVIIQAILVSPKLTLDSVFGAICGYLLLGMAWALLCSVIDSLWPGSFAVSNELAEYAEHGQQHSIADLLQLCDVNDSGLWGRDARNCPCPNLCLGRSDDRPILSCSACGWSGRRVDQQRWHTIRSTGPAHGGYVRHESI